jgi:predicted metal-dependent phosphoesterase TrpH
MIAAAIAAGMDAICFSDHDRLPPPGRVDLINESVAPFRVFPGIEMECAGEHIVVIGLQSPELERLEWRYEDLWRFVEDEGGFLFLAHPYRFQDEVAIDVERFRPGAVEVISCNMGEVDDARVSAFVERHGLDAVCNSDAHRDAYVGLYHNVLDEPASTTAELVEMLRGGRFHCGSLDDKIAELRVTGEKVLR